MVRAVTDDGTFRVIACRSTATVRGITGAQAVTGRTAALLADVTTATVLVRESMAPDLRVQLILQSPSERTRVLADAHPDGSVRGLVQRPSPSTVVNLRDGDVLSVARTLHNGAVQQGSVAVTAAGGASQALMEYMQLSEQVATMCAVGCRFEADDLVEAGGYLVQLLPEVLDPSGPLRVMAERLKDFESMESILAQGITDPSRLVSGAPLRDAVRGRRRVARALRLPVQPRAGDARALDVTEVGLQEAAFRQKPATELTLRLLRQGLLLPAIPPARASRPELTDPAQFGYVAM